jgi:hypothetical protein
MTKLETNQSVVEGDTICLVGARVVDFDVGSSTCTIDFRLWNETGEIYYVEMWTTDLSSITDWSNGSSVFQAIANYKGFTLKE